MLRRLYGGLLAGDRLRRAVESLSGERLVGKVALLRLAAISRNEASPPEILDWLFQEAAKRHWPLSGSLALRLARLAQQEIRLPARYSPSPAGVTVCLAHFNPCNYRLPVHHLIRVVDLLVRARTRVVLAEAIMPNASPLPSLPGVTHLRYRSKSVAFLKENLWNLAAEHADGDALIFLDGDVLFTAPGWLSAVASALDEADCLQPFERCVWLAKDGQPTASKTAVAVPLSQGRWPSLNHYHPGFSWAMRREFFDRMGGWYEFAMTGGGDTAASMAFSPEPPGSDMLKYLSRVNERHDASAEYQRWSRRVAAASPAVGYLPGVTAIHLWHGEHANRNYHRRSLSIGPAPPVQRESNGLLQWQDDQYSTIMKAIFLERQEDG